MPCIHAGIYEHSANMTPLYRASKCDGNCGPSTFQICSRYFFAFCKVQDIFLWPSNRSELDQACSLGEARLFGIASMYVAQEF